MAKDFKDIKDLMNLADFNSYSDDMGQSLVSILFLCSHNMNVYDITLTSLCSCKVTMF